MDKAEVLKQIIETRRSTFPKDYSEKEIDEEILNQILHSATFAPNHKRTRPWRFKVFRNAEKVALGDHLAKIYKESTPAQVFLEKKYQSILDKSAKADTIISISVNFSGLLPEWEEIAATAMAVQNMYLTATAHNVGCYWSTPNIISHLGEFLQLEENQRCYGLFYLGNIIVK